MKRIHPVFSPKYLRPCADDPLPGQHPPPPRPVDIDEKDQEWVVDDVLDSRYEPHSGRLQYIIKWEGLARDANWYNADRGEFEGPADVVNEFHKKYPDKAGPAFRRPRKKKAGTV